MRTQSKQRKEATKGGGYALNNPKQLKQKNDNYVGVPVFLQRFPVNHAQSPLIQKQDEEQKEPLENENLLKEEATLQTKSETNLIQRQDESEELNEPENEEEPGYQPKLTIGSPNDEYEKEADLVADKVMRQPEPDNANVQEEEQEEVLQTKLLNEREIQREAVNDEKILENEQPLVQTKSKSTSSRNSSHRLNKAVRSPGVGSSLSSNVRNKVEPVLGADLSHVKVHNDNTANIAAKSIQAKAFTHKNNIWLGAGQSSQDDQLMAHESTHVVQQSGGLSLIQPSLFTNMGVSSDDTRLMSHEATHVVQQQGHSSQTVVQRAPSVESSNNQVKKFTPKDANRQLKRMLNELGIEYKGKGVVNFNPDDIVITRGNYRPDWLQIWRKYWNSIPFSHSNQPACSLLGQAINKIYTKYDIFERYTLLLNKKSEHQQLVDYRYLSVWIDSNRIREYTMLVRILKKYGYKINMGENRIQWSYNDETYKMPTETTIITPDGQKLVRIIFYNIIPMMQMLVSAYGFKYLKGSKMYFYNDLFVQEKSRLRNSSLDIKWIPVLEKYAQGVFTDSNLLKYFDISNYEQQREIAGTVKYKVKGSNLEVTLQKVLYSCLGKASSLTEQSELSCIITAVPLTFTAMPSD